MNIKNTKTWNQLDSKIQKELADIYAKHNLGNLHAESFHLQNAIAEIYYLNQELPK